MRKEKVKITCKYNPFNQYIFTLFNFDKMKLIDMENEIYYYTEPMDSFLHSKGICCSCSIKLQFGNKQYDTILHDSAFDKLPDKVKSFLISHEIGHILNGDNNITEEESRRIVSKRLFGWLVPMEVKADAYAASIVGIDVAMGVLNFFIHDTDLPLFSKVECFKRYRKIKNMVRCE